MELTVLGSGTAVPRADRGSPGYLVRGGGRTLLLDCGPGAIRAAAAAGVTPLDLDAVLISHFHPDHNLDLAALLFANRSRTYRRERDLPLFAPTGFSRILDHLLAGPQGDWLRPKRYGLPLTEIDPGRYEVAGFEVEAFAVEHADPSFAYRISGADGGPVLAYSGDSTLCDGLVAAGRGADLLLCECAIAAPTRGMAHLTPADVAEVAARARPRRLLLTHFYPQVEAEPIEEIVGRRYDGPVGRAVDGETYAVGGRG